MPRIFISYRRSDSSDITQRIWESLAGIWGEENVIKDTDSFVAGPDFRDQISRAILRCDVVLAIIGQNWSGIDSDTVQSRLFDESDPVRTEIEEAMNYQKVIIPVLVNAREMPKSSELPDNIKQLRYCNAVRIRDDSNFGNDMKKLNGYFVHPDVIDRMGKGALPSDVYVFEDPKGILEWVAAAPRILLCFAVLVVYWLAMGYATPWLFPPEILRISHSNYLLARLWGNDSGLEWLKVFVVVCSLIADWLLVGTVVSRVFYGRLFAISDFAAALLFGTLQFLVAVVILAIGMELARRRDPNRNVINLRKTLLVVSVNALLTYASSFQFLGMSYLYFPAFITVLTVSLFVYTLIGIGLASYSDNLSGMNRVLEKRRQRQERATLLSEEYYERRKALRNKRWA